jgi:hypothetical protein
VSFQGILYRIHLFILTLVSLHGSLAPFSKGILLNFFEILNPLSHREEAIIRYTNRLKENDQNKPDNRDKEKIKTK